MGCVFSCFRVADNDGDEREPESTGFKNFLCLGCLTGQFYKSQRKEVPDPRCSSLHCQHQRLVSLSDKAAIEFEESQFLRRRNIRTQIANASGNAGPSEEEEDLCPTCLEGYNSENPSITLQCCHQFHLSCIYEWMERSEACPICGKVMLFNESE